MPFARTDDGPSYNVTPDELFDLFGKFGPVRYVQRSVGATLI